MPTRINLIGASAYSSTGGIQTVNRLLVREMVSVGSLRTAYFRWDSADTATDDSRDYLKRDLVRFYSVGIGRFARDILGSGIRHPRDLWLCTHLNYSLLGLGASFGRRSRVGVMLHAAELDEAFTTLKRLALLQVGRVFTVSEFTKKKAIALGVRSARIKVLYNGVEDPCPEWEPTRYNRASHTVLFVGRMDEGYKGQRELLDAVSLLRDRLPELRLVFVGGGAYLDEWRAEALRCGLDGRVEFTGRIDARELGRRYASAALFVMPSRNEGFGLVYAEAMAHGLPCIGSDRDAAREVIAPGETGLCVPAGNSTALADAILTLMGSHELRDRMSRAARRRFVENFTAEMYSRRLTAAVAQWREAVG